MNPYTIYVGSSEELHLPTISDPDDDPFSVSVTYAEGTFPAFITYDDVKRVFTFQPSQKDVGTYTLVINMTDSHPLKCKTNIVNFVVNVLLYSPAQL